MLADLVPGWRERAKILQPFSPSAAEAFTQAADDLERALREAYTDAVDLQKAAEYSGYTPDHLTRLIRQGRLRNVGRKFAPRVLRQDLPIKPGHVPPMPVPTVATAGKADLSGLTRQVLSRKLGGR